MTSLDQILAKLEEMDRVRTEARIDVEGRLDAIGRSIVDLTAQVKVQNGRVAKLERTNDIEAAVLDDRGRLTRRYVVVATTIMSLVVGASNFLTTR